MEKTLLPMTRSPGRNPFSARQYISFPESPVSTAMEISFSWVAMILPGRRTPIPAFGIPWAGRTEDAVGITLEGTAPAQTLKGDLVRENLGSGGFGAETNSVDATNPGCPAGAGRSGASATWPGIAPGPRRRPSRSGTGPGD